MGRPPAGDGVTAPATSRPYPRSCGEESRRRPEPRAPDAGSPSRGRGDSPSARASAAHSRIRWGMSAAVASLRAMPEGAPAVGASAADNRNRILVEVCHGLLGGSALGEDLASAVLAGVGSFVGEGLDRSGDEAYSSHGRELLSWGVVFSQLYQDFPPYFSPTVSGTVTEKIAKGQLGGDRREKRGMRTARRPPRRLPNIGNLGERRERRGE